jgi:hypothetical protein
VTRLVLCSWEVVLIAVDEGKDFMLRVSSSDVTALLSLRAFT